MTTKEEISAATQKVAELAEKVTVAKAKLKALLDEEDKIEVMKESPSSEQVTINEHAPRSRSESMSRSHRHSEWRGRPRSRSRGSRRSTPGERKERERPRSRSEGSRRSTPAERKERDQKKMPGTEGLARAVAPIAAAASMALAKPGEYSEEAKERARLDVNKRARPDCFSEFVKEERRLMRKKLMFAPSVVPDVELDDISKNEGAGSEVVYQVLKNMKKAFPTDMTSEDKTFGMFLNRIVQQINIHKLSEREAQELLPDFFDGEMKDMIIMQLTTLGLKDTLELLRYFKKPKNTVLQEKEKINKWKLNTDGSQTVKSQMFQLYTWYSAGFPEKPRTTQLDLFKQKVKEFLPHKSQLELDKKEAEIMIMEGEEMSLFDFADEIEKLVENRMDMSEARRMHVFQTSQEDTSSPEKDQEENSRDRKDHEHDIGQEEKDKNIMKMIEDIASQLEAIQHDLN